MLSEGSDEREFFLWVDPSNFLIQHNLGTIGSFFSGPLSPGDDTPDHLPFIRNENARPGIISPFHSGAIRHYAVEYNLERFRFQHFREHPSRLYAMYLLESRENAEQYREAHPEHVGGRVLKRGITKGGYKFSTHDAGWIDFMRLPHMMDTQTIDDCCNAYWRGERSDLATLQSMGKPWRAPAVTEVLYYGCLDFPDRCLSKND